MSLRLKTLLSIALMLIVFVSMLLALAWFVVLQGFIDLEKSLVNRNLERSTRALAETVNQLDHTVHVWAAWNDTYAFSRI